MILGDILNSGKWQFFPNFSFDIYQGHNMFWAQGSKLAIFVWAHS
jgi:hypothetical protein